MTDDERDHERQHVLELMRQHANGELDMIVIRSREEGYALLGLGPEKTAGE